MINLNLQVKIDSELENKMSVLPQDNFDSLVLPEEEILRHEAHHRLETMYAAGKTLYEEESYVPVNFIPEEAITMIKEWQQKRAELKQVSGSVNESGEHLSADLLSPEPVRICAQSATPRRFYRTFWRSAARRVLQKNLSKD